MIWDVKWSGKSVKQLKKLDKTVARRIRDKVLGITDSPFQSVRRLSDSPFYRMRIGDYRIILDLQQGKLIIFVVELDHRSKIYK